MNQSLLSASGHRPAFLRIKQSLLKYACCCAGLLAGLAGYAQAPSGYSLVWADEFTAPALDTVAWKYRIGVSGTSYQRSENVVIDSGKLRINLKKETYLGKEYTGGGIITKQPRRYGYYEVNVKIDGSYGWHEAFWTSYLSGFDDPNPAKMMPGRIEIDCFEHYPDHATNYFTYGTIEWAPIHGNVNRDYKTVVPNLATSYNTFGFEYTPDYLNYYFNGSLLKTVDTRDLASHDLFLWLSAIATKADATDSGAVFFDYLRCYGIAPANYASRKVPFINYLDSLRGTTKSAGRDLWMEAEDFLQLNNWIGERESGTKVIRGLTSFVAGRDSLQLKAATGIVVDSAAIYTLWVRSRDYATGSGTRKFKVLVNGVEATQVFGDHAVNGYAWENGGRFYLPAGPNKIEIFDLSQYFARCDRLLLTSDTSFIPSGLGGARNVTHEGTAIGIHPFQPDHLVVVRIGDGSSLVAGNANKVFLDEYTTSGSLVRSRPMPTLVLGSHKRLSLPVSTTDHTEGYLSLSADGQYLALGGYDAVPGYAGLSASTYAAVKRVAGLVNAQGFVNTSTVLNTFTGTTIRSVATSNGWDIWATGGNNGIRYANNGDTSSIAVTASTGRCLHIADQQLYSSTTVSGYRIVKVGTGLPITTGHSLTNLPGIVTTSGSPYGMLLLDLNSTVSGPDVLYIADEGNNGLSKYSLVSGSWVFNSRIGSSADTYRGLTGKLTSDGMVVLYATRKNNGSTSGGGEIVRITDSTGYNAAFTAIPQVLVTAATNTLIRGIAMSPGTVMESVSAFAAATALRKQPEEGKSLAVWTGASGRLKVKVVAPTPLLGSIQIYEIGSARLVHQQQLKVEKGVSTTQLVNRLLQTGFYIASFRTSTGSLTTKFFNN